MNAIASLATSALLGTERRPPDWPSAEGPLGELLVKIPRNQTEHTLLQTAGVLATCHLAGWLPQVLPDATSAASADALSTETTPEELSPEWQAIRFSLQRHIPVRFMDLPQAHDLALRSSDKSNLSDKTPEDISHDPLGWLGCAAGYGDEETWWNQMVEERRDGDSAGLFTANSRSHDQPAS